MCVADEVCHPSSRSRSGDKAIRVGASAESEMKPKKEALDDAISANKVAVTEEIVRGGGLALLRAGRR